MNGGIARISYYIFSMAIIMKLANQGHADSLVANYMIFIFILIKNIVIR